MEFVAQIERTAEGEYGSVSLVNNNGELIDLAVSPSLKIAKIIKEALEAALERSDELLVRKLESLT